jgi:uncharacterized membrane protein (DUF4010 family)
MNPTTTAFPSLGIALFLGLLVGLQRERTAPGMPGMRTFPLITVLGTVCGILAKEYSNWVLAAGFLSVVAILGYSTLLRAKQKEPDPGTTTEMAALLMFAVGALLAVESLRIVAVAVGAGVAVLLQFKPELHRVAERLGDEDLRAIMQFVLITCIVLPVLPNRTFDPLNVLNPFKTWLIVVFIVGLSLSGYIIYKFFGRGAGIILGGILGGAISSTATTLGYSRQVRRDPAAMRAVAVVIMIATTVSFLRVLLAVAVVSRDFLATVALPVSLLLLLTLLPSLLLWFCAPRQPCAMPSPQNPTELRSAVAFGVMYSLVLFCLAAAQRYVPGHGLYLVAGLSGLTDMDAITLSTARMSLRDPDILHSGWRLIVLAALANLVSKAALAGILGGRRLLQAIVVLFLPCLIGGALLLWLATGS